MSTTPHTRTAGALVATVVLLLAAHWLLFAAYVRREIAWAYAPNFDQTSGLFIAYRTWEDVLQHGLAAGLADALRRSPPNGATLHLEAVLVFLLTGPSRLASLAVNWLHFALLQGALVWALWATTRRWELPALGLGLLLSMQMPFYWAGGIADFRPDFIAFCLYGTFLAVVWRSELFRRRAWSIVAGAVGALCVVSRSLTTVYLGGLLGLSLAVWAIRWWRERDPLRRQDLRRQLTGAALCAACVGLVAFPALALRARSLWDYYVVGHVIGPGNTIWAELFAGPTLSGRLLFYPRSALFDHGGTLFLALAVGALVALGIGSLLAREPRDGGPPAQGMGWFMATGLLLPLTVLTADTAKSPVVGGLLLVPLLWLILTFCSRLAHSSARSVARVVALSALAAGGATHFARLAGPAPPGTPVEAVREALRLHDDIVRWSVDQAWPRPVLLTDRQRDYVPAIRVSAYERHGLFLPLERPLANVIMRPSTEEVLETLRRSHFVILTRPQAGSAVAVTYPHDGKLAELYPRLLAYCKRTMVRVGNYQLPEEVMLFARAPGPQTSTTTP